jgi:hypothetical protein
MAQTDRIFYAVQAVGMGSTGAVPQTGAGGTIVSTTFNHASFKWMHGVQSAGFSTTFNVDNLFEYGQLQIYQFVDEVPDIEVTLEKVLDGYPGLYLMSVGQDGTGNVIEAAKNACNVYLAIYPDSFTYTGSGGGTGAANSLLFCSGMRVSNVSYTFGVDGNFTESVTLQGNDKKWYTPSSASGEWVLPFNNTDEPVAGLVAKRQAIEFDANKTVLPTEVSSNVRDNNGNIQTISISADFGRENNFELGRYRPYTKFTTLPLQVTCDFEVLSLSGDIVDATSDAPRGTGYNRQIVVYADIAGSSNPTTGVYKIDLGSGCRLTSVNYTGGDTGGGNATVTYSYTVFNKFSVTDSTSAVTGYWS